MPAEQAVDMLNDTLAEIVFRTKNVNKFKRLARNTHFNYREVEALAIIHRKCVQILGPISRILFRDLFHAGFDFTENIRHILVDKMFSVIDKRNALQIHCDNWIEGLSVILRGTIEEKIHFAYQTYDHLRTHKLKKEHIFPMMRGCLIKLQNDENPDEAVKDLIDLLIKKLDVDRDGTISEEDFKTAVRDRNPLLLECMGPVFPSREARHVFLSTFTDRGLDLANPRLEKLTARADTGSRGGEEEENGKSDRRDPPVGPVNGSLDFRGCLSCIHHDSSNVED